MLFHQKNLFLRVILHTAVQLATYLINWKPTSWWLQSTIIKVLQKDILEGIKLKVNYRWIMYKLITYNKRLNNTLARSFRNSQLPMLRTMRFVVNIPVQWLMWLTTFDHRPWPGAKRLFLCYLFGWKYQ